MRTILALAAIAMIGAAGAAYATGQEDRVATETVTAPTVDRIKSNMDKLGYQVERTKEGDGIYKMRLVDRESGGKIEAHFDTTTGELTRAKLASEDDKAESREEVRDRKEKREHKEHREKGRQNRDQD